MKKFIIIIILIIAGIVSIFLINNMHKVKIEELQKKYEIVEKDGYYNNKGEEAGGFIVGKKTESGYKYGYIMPNGKKILDLEYGQIERVMDIKSKNIYLISVKNGRYGLTKNGKELLKYEYQLIEYNPESETYTIQKNDKKGATNINGKIILPVEYDIITANGIYLYAQKGEKKQVYSNNGKTVNIDFNTTIKSTSNQNYFINIKSEGEKYLYGLLDNKFNQKIDNKYLYLEYISDQNFIACNMEEKQGIINENDEIKLEFKYNLVQKLVDRNIIQATAGEETTLYNLNLQELCTMKDADIELKDNGITEITNDSEKIILDKDGNKK